ncbi:MAG TPA: tetratricopeptide repeat protein [Candidatus Koribacter sp.]|jgi:TolA-binding protein
MRSQKNDFDTEEKDFLGDVKLPACPEIGLLYSAREGILPEDQATSLNAHLATCEVCRLLGQDLDAIEFGNPTASDAANIRERITQSAPRAFQRAERRPGWLRRRWWVPTFALAACAILAVVLLRSTEPQTASSALQVATAKPIPDIPVDKLPIHVDPAALLATRGAATAGEPSGAEMVKALSRYQKSDYAAAVDQFKTLTQKYPNDATVPLYLGVSELFLGQTDPAAADLTRAKALNQGDRQADASWYLGVAELRLKNVTAAMPLFHDLCQGKSTYADRACTIESQLK